VTDRGESSGDQGKTKRDQRAGIKEFKSRGAEGRARERDKRRNGTGIFASEGMTAVYGPPLRASGEKFYYAYNAGKLGEHESNAPFDQLCFGFGDFGLEFAF